MCVCLCVCVCVCLCACIERERQKRERESIYRCVGKCKGNGDRMKKNLKKLCRSARAD